MNVYTLIPPRMREGLLQLRGMLKKGKKEQIEEISALAASDSPNWYNDPADVAAWKKAFQKLTLESDKRGMELAKEFFSQALTIVEEKYCPGEASVILICAAKNECGNMKNIYRHYRALGVDHFAFIDNDSDDNSIAEYRTMEGVNIFSVTESYTSLRRQAWVNRIIAHYGFNKWYLVVDSDEFLDYNQSEIHKISDVVNFCKNQKITRMRGLLVDMYPREIRYNNQEIDYLKEYLYFDRDSYAEMTGKEALLLRGIQGGIRGRLFSKASTDAKPWLTKYPLFFMQKGDIQFQSHMSFPFYKNFQSGNHLVIRHYKFLPSDLEKYRMRVRKGNFSRGSQEYKQYVTEMEKGYIRFFDETHSESFSSSESFYNIPVMTKIPWRG